MNNDETRSEMTDRIKQLMEAQHMNQLAFAKFTGINPATLNGIFTGRSRPTINHVDAILDTFPNVNPVWLLRGRGGMLLNANGSDGQEAENSASGIAGITVAAGTGAEGASESVNGEVVGTDTMAEQPSLFSAHNAVAQSPYRNARKSGYASHAEPTVQPKAVNVVQRKITEIRVFFDDQTWESFVPKK